VEKGEGMATRLGCPTANLAVGQGAVIPGLGVYVGETEYDMKRVPSVICVNDGRTGSHLKLEVHLLDQCEDLGGKVLSVRLLEKMRPLVPFVDEASMSALIAKDLEEARAWFAGRPDGSASQSGVPSNGPI